jgi:adenylate cyclase
MFVDIRGFTFMAEQLNPADVAVQLNRFYEIATRAIFRFDGTLDKLVGNQVMAFFGAPIDRNDHPQRAVQTALEISSPN